MLSRLFDGAGPLATGLGQNRLSEALTGLLLAGSPDQQSAAQASAVSMVSARAGTLEFHERVAAGELTEEPFLRGRALAERLGYPVDVVDRFPDRLVERFIGLANPFVFGGARPGEVVIDVGCGAGLDAAIAAADVGPTGFVVGLDATESMVRLAQALVTEDHATTPGGSRSFLRSFAEQLPLSSASADLIVSNGVFMMCDRPAALADCHRVLRPGGRLQFSEIILDQPDRSALEQDWLSTGSKAISCDQWAGLLGAAGFIEVEFGTPCWPERSDNLGVARARAVRAVKPHDG